MYDPKSLRAEEFISDGRSANPWIGLKKTKKTKR